MADTRFAPSPSGFLHLGHALAALVAWEAAQSTHGRFQLRIEDLDRARCHLEYESAIKEDLAWLGLAWPEPTRRQSDHGPDYAAALDRLRGLGVVYPCFCTRSDIHREIAAAAQAPHGPDGPLYPGTCRGMAPGERESTMAAGRPFAWRLDIARGVALTGPLKWEDQRFGRQTATPAVLGDVVLARKDTGSSYHLAVVVDDAIQGIGLVTRGDDLLPCTHVHRLLQALLQLPTPGYWHHPLVRDETGRRLAKRDDSTGLRALRADGVTPAEIRRRLGPYLNPAAG